MDIVNKKNDKWGKEVEKRLNSVIYLVTEEAKYQ